MKLLLILALLAFGAVLLYSAERVRDWTFRK